ncbi:MAG TPA: hypothetical protein VNH18_03895, partial [Bryobacteraceae bacterium]|nr:hypothetical protein [Bryobacteraceae bacterium]
MNSLNSVGASVSNVVIPGLPGFAATPPVGGADSFLSFFQQNSGTAAGNEDPVSSDAPVEPTVDRLMRRKSADPLSGAILDQNIGLVAANDIPLPLKLSLNLFSQKPALKGLRMPAAGADEKDASSSPASASSGGWAMPLLAPLQVISAADIPFRTPAQPATPEAVPAVPQPALSLIMPEDQPTGQSDTPRLDIDSETPQAIPASHLAFALRLNRASETVDAQSAVAVSPIRLAITASPDGPVITASPDGQATTASPTGPVIAASPIGQGATDSLNGQAAIVSPIGQPAPNTKVFTVTQATPRVSEGSSASADRQENAANSGEFQSSDKHSSGPSATVIRVEATQPREASGGSNNPGPNPEHQRQANRQEGSAPADQPAAPLPAPDPGAQYLTPHMPVAHTASPSQGQVLTPSSEAAPVQPQAPAATLNSEPPAKTGQASQLSFSVPVNDHQKIEVRVMDRAGEVRVSVRTPNEDLATSLRED